MSDFAKLFQIVKTATEKEDWVTSVVSSFVHPVIVEKVIGIALRPIFLPRADH